MHIKNFLRWNGFAAAAVLQLLIPTSILHAQQMVHLSQGRLQGKPSTERKVTAYLGIPYAAPPVGPLRWQPPQPPSGWHGIRSAETFGSRCMQLPLFGDMVFRDPGQSEDCLTLNVWTPTTKKNAHLPVMVWIYGGGFVTGGTSEPRQDGEHLAHKDVVVVSMNYRLGIFGFLALPSLVAESPSHAAGNYGLMDQTAALKWVQHNIAAFGGDPANVTLFGESAGSISVSAQMASPLSRGLFARAIGESGGAFRTEDYYFPPLAESSQHTQQFIQTKFPSTNLAELRSIPAEKILQASSEDSSVFCPVIDGQFLPQSISAIYAHGKQAHIPLLAGWNRDEGTAAALASADPQTLETLKTTAARHFGPHAEEFLRAYSAATDAEALRALEDFSGDTFIAYSTWAWLEAHTATGNQPVYRYRFDLASPGDPQHPLSDGAFHSDDIEYVFGNLDSRSGAKWRPEDYLLSELMQNYWTRFARTGNPNSPGLPHWPAYNAATQWQVMHLEPNAQPRPDQHRARYLFLQKYWGERKAVEP